VICAAGAADKIASKTKGVALPKVSTPDVSGAAKKAQGAVKNLAKDVSLPKVSTPDVRDATKKAQGAAKKFANDVTSATSSSAGGSVAGGNSRLSRPLVRDSLGQLRPQSVNNTGAAGGGDKRGVKMAKKAGNAVSEAVDNISAN
jgi:hypothetical protein